MTNKQLITEGLDFQDMKDQIIPTVTVDEYAAKMGSDSDIVTLAFIVKNEAVGEDLSEWFEKGYEYVLDAQVSEGEITNDRWLVFVELKRRSAVPERIIELIKDLKTLTDLTVEDWEVKVDGKNMKPELDILKQAIICNPNEYKKDVENEEELNEMREIAGLDSKKLFADNEYTLYLKSIAGLR